MIKCDLKRLLDVILSACSIAILSPLFLPVILVLRFTGEGEIFYLQKRLGYLKVVMVMGMVNKGEILST